MLYLIGQIILCLLFTALIGVAVGWLLRGLGTERQMDQVLARWKATAARLTEQRNEALAQVNQLTTDGQTMTLADSSSSADTSELKKLLAERDRELAALRTAQFVRTPAGESSNQALTETQQLCQQLQGHLADYKSANDQLENRLKLALDEREVLITRLRDAESETARLNQDRGHAINTIAGLQKEMRGLRGAAARRGIRLDSEPATETGAGNDHAGQNLSTAAGRPEPSPPAATPAAPSVPSAASPTPLAAQSPDTGSATPQQPKQPQVDESPRQQAFSITPDADSPSSSTTTANYTPAWQLESPDGAPDNLQAIYGIGPKLAAKLNQLGIFHFRQIANFSKQDILWIAQHLKSFPGRILRDRWVEQARSLESRRNR